MFKETLVKCKEGAFHLGPERPRVYSDLSPEEKDRYNADSRATNILLQGSPKDIYTLINHYTDAKAIWDNVKIFLEGGQDNAVDEDVDEQLDQDLALNVNNVFQADNCDAFDFDVDEAPTAQTMFMVNLSSAYPVYDKVGLSYDSDILSEPAQHITVTTQNNVVDNSLSAEHATSKEQVKLYKRRAKFKLTEKEQKIDEQLRIVITNRNIKEEILKKELHFVKMQLSFGDKMADENVLASVPTRSDDQIHPFAAWVSIGKSNFVLDLHKRKKNLIFHIFIDILHNTNFFKAFTASVSVLTIKLQPKIKERRRLECKQPKSKPAIEKSGKPAPALKSKATKERPSKASTTKPPKLKPTKEKSTKTTQLQKAGKCKITKVRKKNKALDNMSWNIGSKVFILEHRDPPHKIDEFIHESRMFETGTYKSLPKHVVLYEALEASMERANRDELLTKMDNSRKRRCDGQDPPPSLPNLDLSKRRRHDTNTSGLSQPQAPHSSAWKKSDTRDDTPSSSKQQSGPHAEQPVKDLPMLETANISDSEDIDSAH
uniref:Integrase, catalytic region, zinc finger, CCHC-type, peptidase aspartic, catalytic n=1 Tax=Tanacetum cinerariifolium TaxID=118510 RepID=A0A6L2K901_TANCI|nr:integrase, catalytic region, zinc finger, CCHC-type, peptidase aspartic, catalytic [Tanacetum cinerariifolium]